MRRPDIDDPELTLEKLFVFWPSAAVPFLSRQMLCPGCPVAPFHTVAEAAEEYGLEEAELRCEIRQAIGRL
ncbi:hypothetical protein PVW46_25150 [Mameliella sp. AT18]|uniref:hypothetical protein n=1 Tax=Mameliella sp. AT18 TaxID=3028385 RepID=UPI000841122F|nr:hypothetical protein [Mameliella sp. AT18]MDD9733202.1 hypothetical protein [Mameliella sp. AT18]ODM49804.1 hypothetical protein A9320_13705 [Ruegeria sp. PBVC088]